MKLSKSQIIYIIISSLFIVVIIAIPLMQSRFRSHSNGNGEKPELANLKEVGVTRVLEGKYKNATVTLRLKYEDARRQKFFEETLAESWGFDAKAYHVFILDVQLEKVTLQTLPNGKDIKTNALESFEIPDFELTLKPMDAINIGLDQLNLKNTSKQGKLVKDLNSKPMILKTGEKTSRYVFFKKDFKFEQIESAKMIIASGNEISLMPKSVEYAIPPTVPKSGETN